MPCQVVHSELACPLSGTPTAVGSEPDAMYTSGFYSRFTFVSKELSSSDAEDYCQMLGGHLASFQNDQEQVGPVSKLGTCTHMHDSEVCSHSHSCVLQLVVVQRLLAACKQLLQAAHLNGYGIGSYDIVCCACRLRWRRTSSIRATSSASFTSKQPPVFVPRSICVIEQLSTRAGHACFQHKSTTCCAGATTTAPSGTPRPWPGTSGIPMAT